MDSDTISAIANCITALGTLGAVGVASYGLSLWKQQLVGEDEYDLAKTVLSFAFQVNLNVMKLRMGKRYNVPLFRTERIEHQLEPLLAQLESTAIAGNAYWGISWFPNTVAPFTYLAARVLWNSPITERNDDGTDEFSVDFERRLASLVEDLSRHLRKHEV